MTTTETPGDLRFSPYDYAIHEDPYPTYARLRDEAPLFHNAEEDFWGLSRYADVIDGFRDTARLSSSYGVSLDASAYSPGAHRTSSFIAMDAPRHGRMRGLVSRAFTPRRVERLEPAIRALARAHLDRALARGDEFDLIAEVAGKLPMDVVSELMGVPPADRDELRRLADLVLHREPGVRDVPPAGVDASFALVAYYADLVADRRRRPTDDLASALVAAELDGKRLSDDDIIAFLFLMVVAGNETTTKLLGHAWYWGWRHPDERAKPLADPGRIADWVEETLRYDSSTQFLVRIATEDIALHGGVVPSGGKVVLVLGSANRDPRAFPDPDRYDLDRTHDAQLASLASAATSAWGRRWPGSRPGSRSRSSSPGWPTTTSTRPAPSGCTRPTYGASLACPPRSRGAEAPRDGRPERGEGRPEGLPSHDLSEST